MIFVTGDTHGDLSRFDDHVLKKLKSGDSLIICGDFGFIWNGSEKEKKILYDIGKHKYNVFFVDGKHENFDLLSDYEVIDKFGSKIQHITGNLYHMMRGQVYVLDGKSIFTFGGGESPDKDLRVSAGTWWSQEMPGLDEMRDSIKVLDLYDRKVDYIVTHEPPAYINKMVDRRNFKINPLASFFDSLSKEVQFEKWFFGCTHIDRKVTSKYFSVFSSVVRAYAPIRRKHFTLKTKR